jgi:hypothetical protein
MMETIVVLLIVIGLLLLIFAYEWRTPEITLLCGVVWLIAALATLEIEIPYQMYNASASEIQTGVHVFSEYGITLLFMGIAVVMVVGFVSQVLHTLRLERQR